METDNFHNVVHACRFCFMCRHLAPIGNVTFRESDTPRGRALMMDKVRLDPAVLRQPDVAQTLYDADLSGACRTHCVSHFDEVGLVLAARRDLVTAGLAPAHVDALARALAAEPVASEGPESAEVVYFIDRHTARHQPEILAAVKRLFSAAGIACRFVGGVDNGKALRVLGFWEQAEAGAASVAEVVCQGSPRLLVTACPAQYDGFRSDYPAMGVGLGMDVLHTSDFLANLLETGQLQRNATAAPMVHPLASDYLRNYAAGHDGMGRLLEALGVPAARFGTNSEESYTAGEGAVVLDELNPKLVGRLAAQVASRVRNPGSDLLLTASPYSRYALRHHAGPGLQVLAVEELVAQLAL